MMHHNQKSKEELLKELNELQERYASLDQSFNDDLVSHKRTEEALQISEQRFKLAMEASNDGLFDWNLLNNEIYYSPGWKKMLGYEEHELRNEVSIWEKLTEPEDAKKTWELLDSLISKKTNRFVLEFKMRHKKGFWVDILSRAEAFYNDAGKAIRVVGTHTDISERKLAELNLRKEKEQIRTILDLVGDPIFVKDNDHRIIIANTAFHKIFNLGEEEVIGFTLAENVPNNERQNFLAVDRIVLDSGVSDLREEKMTVGNNARTIITRKTRFIDEEGSKFLVGSIHDITDLKLAEMELVKAKERAEENEEKFKVYAQYSPIAIYTTDENGNCIYANNKWLEIAGMTLKECLGMGWVKSLHPDDKDSVLENWTKSVKSYGSWAYEYRFINSKGKITFVEGSAKALFNKENKLIGYLGSNVDITDRKKAELLLLERNEELHIAKDKAEESDRLKSAFLANMSHEIRTPMNSIMGFSELLREPNLTGEQQHKYVRIIGESGVRMLNIIDDIVDISKIEAGLMVVDMENVDVNEQIENIYSLFNPEVEAKGMHLSFKNALPDNEAIIETDGDKLFAILSNLVKNSIKYSEKGTIELGYELIKETEGSVLQFFVKDTGIGILADRQEAIFERFIQADIHDEMARQGAGLGLAISKSYVEMLGGKIWVESLVGKGSGFYFSLPYTGHSELNIGNQHTFRSNRSD